MASYKETVLWSGSTGTGGNLTLSGHPSAYDYLRVSYGSPAIPRTATTSFQNLGAMWTVEIPYGNTNYLDICSNFYGNCNTASANTMYRAPAMWSGISGTSWTRVFNVYGLMTSYSATNPNPWQNIYSVVGVKTGDTGYFHKDLLYSRDRDGTAVVLNRNPSSYNRIGVSFNLAFERNSSTNRSVETYCEYPYSFLTAYNNGYKLFQHPFFEANFSASQRVDGLALYSGVSGTAWKSMWNMNFNQTGAGSILDSTSYHVVTRVVGIDRK